MGRPSNRGSEVDLTLRVRLEQGVPMPDLDLFVDQKLNFRQITNFPPFFWIWNGIAAECWFPLVPFGFCWFPILMKGMEFSTKTLKKTIRRKIKPFRHLNSLLFFLFFLFFSFFFFF